MKILIACEESGTIREEFSRLGHDAWSCDIQPTRIPGNHIIGDVMTVIDNGWDMMIAHPPCTYLAYSGNGSFKKQPDRMEKALDAYKFFMALYNAPIKHIAVENPRGLPMKWFRKPDQTIQPWQFGDPYTKATCLWLKQLPPLLYTIICTDPFKNWATKGKHKTVKGSESKSRSKTFDGIANAMAIQWSEFAEHQTA